MKIIYNGCVLSSFEIDWDVVCSTKFLYKCSQDAILSVGWW